MRFLFKPTMIAVLTIILAIMMASCSFKTLYNELENFIPYYVEGMVSLDGMLEEKVAKRALVLVNWHRNTQLTQYAKWLQALQRDIKKNKLTEEKTHKHIAALDSFWQSISLKIDEEMVLLLPLLNAEQREELFTNIDDKNTEFREEYIELEKEERIEQYAERLINSYETWLGDLTDKQEASVKQAAAKLQSTASYRLERRQQWQQSIKYILDTNNSASQMTASLSQFFTDYKSQVNVAMNALIKINKNIISGLTLQISNSMTAEQKAHFIMRTNDYIRMFEELAKER